MKKKKMILAGGSGYVGTLLARFFEAKGWEVVVLTRRPSQDRDVGWDGETDGDWIQVLQGGTVLINLCGKSVNCRYNERNQRELLHSRIAPTRALGRAMVQVEDPPEVWMNASTATLYRHTQGPAWDEQGETGDHPAAKDAFSIALARAWEQAFLEEVPVGVRPLLLRSAMVMGHDNNPNNVFRVLRRLVGLGLGGAMGSGTQYVSWIHAQDFCRAVEFLLNQPEISGVVNLCAPEPLRNHEMMRELRQHLHRPFGLPAPQPLLELGAWLLRTETELVIKSRRVIPGKLLKNGFEFVYPDFAAAAANLCVNPK